MASSSQPEQLISGSVQSMDDPVPSSTVAPPTVTSDYFSDSVQEEMNLDNPQIAQDNLPMVPPTAAPARTNLPVHTAVATSNQSQVPTGERKPDSLGQI